MRRFLATAVFAVIILAMFAPPGLAQAPTPKVTISGLFDQVTSMGRNFYDGNLARDSDREWYARTRFRPDFEFAVAGSRLCSVSRSTCSTGSPGPTTAGSRATIQASRAAHPAKAHP